MNLLRTSYYLPTGVLTNDMLANEFGDWNSKKIYRKTGIANRHIIGDSETTLDMAVCAAQKLEAEQGIELSKTDFVIMVTQSPDYVLPTTACMVQDRLGIPKSAGAFDINLGCSGFVYGLSVAKALVSSRIVDNCLLITSEAYSRWINKKDKSVRTLFGDAATATFVDGEICEKMGGFVFGTDGSGFDKLIIPVGGLKNRPSSESSMEETDENGYTRTRENLYMDGGAIFNFSMETVPRLVSDILKKNNLTKEQVDMFVLHQANKFMLQSLRDLMEIRDEKFYIDIEDTGNTVSSTIPIALKKAFESNVIREGMTVLIAGFGVGLSWGGTVLKL